MRHVEQECVAEDAERRRAPKAHRAGGGERGGLCGCVLITGSAQYGREGGGEEGPR